MPGLLLRAANFQLLCDFDSHLQRTLSLVQSTSSAHGEVYLHISGSLRGIPKCPTGCRPKPPSCLKKKKRTLLWTSYFIQGSHHLSKLSTEELGLGPAQPLYPVILSHLTSSNLSHRSLHTSCILFVCIFIYTWVMLSLNYFSSLMSHPPHAHILQLNLCTYLFLYVKLLL